MMKKNINLLAYVAILAGSITGTSGCTDKTDLPEQPLEDYEGVYMPAAVNGAKNLQLRISDEPPTITYGANYGGYGVPAQDIPVSFIVDVSKLDSFNLANGTNYSLLPGSGYSLSDVNSVIPRGAVATPPLSISVHTKGPDAIDILTPYLLPVTLDKAGMRITEGLRTAFFVVTASPDKKEYPDFDRSAWQVLEMSSEEANGEGPNNGKLKFIFDNDKNTFWHSQWQGGSPGPPHYFVIDLGSEKELHGFSFTDRQNSNNGRPKEVSFSISTDNLSWSDAGSLTLESTNEVQTKFVKGLFNRTARYLKVTITASYDASYVHLAEFNAF